MFWWSNVIFRYAFYVVKMKHKSSIKSPKIFCVSKYILSCQNVFGQSRWYGYKIWLLKNDCKLFLFFESYFESWIISWEVKRLQKSAFKTLILVTFLKKFRCHLLFQLEKLKHTKDKSNKELWWQSMRSIFFWFSDRKIW